MALSGPNIGCCQCDICRRAATDSSLQQTENTFLAMKDTIEAAYAANLASLKEKLKNRPDAPICTKCKKPVDRYHALRMICVSNATARSHIHALRDCIAALAIYAMLWGAHQLLQLTRISP
ncbi:hypothetical protein CYMTET_7873 [Cymbomonas tetramitiformis]|uniref:Uncharacterized protein n=1 Tax=Cymbomonas tetramitiformis TaxID=36881 RepID=A0AAE0LGM7_9CHLO|nr:hypothetical protein CYMTET_7873 [Cymbomonas tetramitiformis]